MASSCSTITMAAAAAAAIPSSSFGKKATLSQHKPSMMMILPLNISGMLPSKAATRFQVKASSDKESMKEKAITGMTAAAITASMMIPVEVAEAAESASGVSPSLKNFLLSILAGGVVLTAILGAIIAVSNFDPVKRS